MVVVIRHLLRLCKPQLSYLLNGVVVFVWKTEECNPGIAIEETKFQNCRLDLIQLLTFLNLITPTYERRRLNQIRGAQSVPPPQPQGPGIFLAEQRG